MSDLPQETVDAIIKKLAALHARTTGERWRAGETPTGQWVVRDISGEPLIMAPTKSDDLLFASYAHNAIPVLLERLAQLEANT